jgi:hypothetical protein
MVLKFDKNDLRYIKYTIDWMLENMELKDNEKDSESLYSLSMNSINALERGLTVGFNEEKATLPINSVTHRALQMKIEKLEAENKLLAFMVENGLGEDDIKAIHRSNVANTGQDKCNIPRVSECTDKEKTLFDIAFATRLPSYGDLLYALEVAGISDDNIDMIIRRASILCPNYKLKPTRQK